MEEIVAIVSFFVILPTIIALTVTSLKKAKYEAMKSNGGDGLRASELQSLIRDAVADAVAPLVDRLEALEPDTAEPRIDLSVLADVLEDGEDDRDVSAARRRAQS